jgi:poly(beta-D-mannuronate) lyase
MGLLSSCFAEAKTIPVKNMAELEKANKEAKPGDIVILQNGEWKNSILRFNCSATKEKPIVFKAQTAGKVMITGTSRLEIGGTYLIIDGFYFTNGYAGQDAVITFRINNNQLANNCRVTNTVINDFNNPKRMDDNYWVSFYGKNNRIDHCSFLNKKNIGVLLAVILEDERSRQNFHSIDHNYFGRRLPLASNAGEIIRVGVSQHCEFNSNTQITDNFFEKCDGETEIVSLKSGSNTIRNNVFKECQGAVVLRHGNFNTVENNIFLGNHKAGTGAVRIINKGQWVINNLFYQCRGTGFRAPLSIMNGVPNSPAFRYVTASDAVIANNSFYDCAPVSFCEGSDTERLEPPKNIAFLNNVFYNKNDSKFYLTYDNMDGFHFSGNRVDKWVQEKVLPGFKKATITLQKVNAVYIPVADESTNNNIPDSLTNMATSRIAGNLSATPGFAGRETFLKLEANAYKASGAKWFGNNTISPNKKTVWVKCATVAEIQEQMNNNIHNNLVINLTAKEYHFSSPLYITSNTSLVSWHNSPIRFTNTAGTLPFMMQLKAGNNLMLMNLQLDLVAANSNIFISTDTSGSSNHSNLNISNCRVSNLAGTFLNAAKSSVTDSITIYANSFTNNNGSLFSFVNETDKKGYYNVELLKITNNSISNHKGQILAMLRGGNDESTMGPALSFRSNTISNSNTGNEQPLIHLYGTQVSKISGNTFSNSNPGGSVLLVEDAVRANHRIKQNKLIQSGKIVPNKFTQLENNEEVK